MAEFILFPADDGFFDKHFRNGARFEAILNGFLEFVFVECETGTRSAQRIGGPNHGRVIDFLAECARFFQRVDHGLLEFAPIFGLTNGGQFSPDQFAIVLFQDTRLGQIDGQIQARLATDRGQERVGAFLGDDPFEKLHRQGLNINPVGGFGICHDRGGVAIGEYHLEALFAEGLTCLGAGIVKLAGLANHNRTGPNQQNLFYISSFWHGTLRDVVVGRFQAEFANKKTR